MGRAPVKKKRLTTHTPSGTGQQKTAKLCNVDMPLSDLDDTSRKRATPAKPYPWPHPLNGLRPATRSTAAAATSVAAVEALLSLWDTGRVPPIESIPLGGNKNPESFEDIPGPVDNESEEEGDPRLFQSLNKYAEPCLIPPAQSSDSYVTVHKLKP